MRIEPELIHLLKHHPPEVMDSQIFRLLRIEPELIHLLKHHPPEVMDSQIFQTIAYRARVNTFAEAPPARGDG
ncbi:MAG: hypothetical protein F6K22_36950 [Okeania sp. SIO2F4]|uniref:hypothetical protein n=1 Tax=Okeania sp. SIO2F4 TaxID=2607790 RepID=UPI00142CF54E|nr:hypothetical protein [Okeania sp. SIO2F4]NES07890.1 hypothetical protein [Okeania sp. SIO2F4]